MAADPTATVVVTAHPSWFVRWGLRPFTAFTLRVDERPIGSVAETGASIEIELRPGRHRLSVSEGPDGSAASGSLVRPPLAVSTPDPAQGALTLVVTDDGAATTDVSPAARLARRWRRGWQDSVHVTTGETHHISCRLKIGNSATWFAFYPVPTTRAGRTTSRRSPD